MLEPKKGGEEQRNKHYAVIPMMEYHWFNLYPWVKYLANCTTKTLTINHQAGIIFQTKIKLNYCFIPYIKENPK